MFPPVAFRIFVHNSQQCGIYFDIVIVHYFWYFVCSVRFIYVLFVRFNYTKIIFLCSYFFLSISMSLFRCFGFRCMVFVS